MPIFADQMAWALSTNAPQDFRHQLRPRLSQVLATGSRTPIVYEPVFSVTRELQYGNRRFTLRQPIRIQTDYRDGLWFHESPELSIVACAPLRSESLNSFCMDFAAIWDHIAQQPDTTLSEDARQLKGKLLQIVEAAL